MTTPPQSQEHLCPTVGPGKLSSPSHSQYTKMSTAKDLQGLRHTAPSPALTFASSGCFLQARAVSGHSPPPHSGTNTEQVEQRKEKANPFLLWLMPVPYLAFSSVPQHFLSWRVRVHNYHSTVSTGCQVDDILLVPPSAQHTVS